MLYLVEILAAIGIRTAGIEAVIAFATRVSGSAFFRNSFVRNKLIGWAGGIISAIEFGHWLQEVVKKYLSKVFDEVVDSLDFEEIKHAAGRAFAKTFARKLLEKYGIDCPITDFYSETIAEEVGDWLADLINEKISFYLGEPVQVVSTVFPPDNIPVEVDSFMTDQINIKLGVNLTSVFLNKNIANDLKEVLAQKFSEELTNIVEQAKGQAINTVMSNTDYSPETVMEVVDALQDGFSNVLAIVDGLGFLGKPLATSRYYSEQRKKIHNKMRQREYRKTHKEVRHWEAR